MSQSDRSGVTVLARACTRGHENSPAPLDNEHFVFGHNMCMRFRRGIQGLSVPNSAQRSALPYSWES